MFFGSLSFNQKQDFLSDDFKSQGSHVPYNVADFSTQVTPAFNPQLDQIYIRF